VSAPEGRPGRPSPDATITHQAVERVGDITRCWSRWTDGTITHDDTVYTYMDTPRGIFTGTMHVNVGVDRGMWPPPGLKWVDTVALRREIDATGNACPEPGGDEQP
jgi:hypothetical protein